MKGDRGSEGKGGWDRGCRDTEEKGREGLRGEAPDRTALY